MAVQRKREMTSTNLEYQKGEDNSGNPIIKKTSAIRIKESATPDQINALANALGDILNFPLTYCTETRLDQLINVQA